jgi:hypothetical protein
MQGWLNIHKSINVIYHNRMKNKNHMIISIYAKGAFDKIKHPFMINALDKLRKEDRKRIEGSYLNIIYGKHIDNIRLNGKS